VAQCQGEKPNNAVLTQYFDVNTANFILPFIPHLVFLPVFGGTYLFNPTETNC